jgi:hypothetical protein
MSELKTQYADPISNFRFYTALALVTAASVIQLMSEGKSGFAFLPFWVGNLMMWSKSELQRRVTKKDWVAVFIGFLLLGLLIGLGHIPMSKRTEQVLQHVNPFLVVSVWCLLCFAFYRRYKKSHGFRAARSPLQERMSSGGADDHPPSPNSAGSNRLTSKAPPPMRGPQEW